METTQRRSQHDRHLLPHPAVDRLKARNPIVHGLASKEAEPPGMWGRADLPLLTASGADPSVLLSLPPGVRHYAASLTTRGELMALLDSQAGAPAGMVVDSPGWDEYQSRVSEWASGLHGGPVVEPTAEDAEALAEAMFPGTVLPEIPVDRVAEAAARNLAAAQDRIRAGNEDWAKYQASDLAKP